MPPSITIDKFWSKILPEYATGTSAGSLPGWHLGVPNLPRFIEAPQHFSDLMELLPQPPATWSEIECRRVWLVSAPGAVGKTTLAREISARTGAIYVDLASTDPVAGYFITGGLDRYGMLNAWKTGAVGLVIDALDEAQSGVPKAAFDAFMADVWARALDVNQDGRPVPPPILFGRSNAIEDAALELADTLPPEDLSKIGLVEIGYYDHDAAIRFASAAERAMIADVRQVNEHDKAAIELILDHLRNAIDGSQNVKKGSNKLTEGEQFCGYAPVLMAVARRVAEDSNPYGLIQDLNKPRAAGIDITEIAAEILRREQRKITWTAPTLQRMQDDLYTPEQQLSHLSAGLYRTMPPGRPSPISPGDFEAYDNALDRAVPAHPFLAGRPDKASSAVFEANVCVHALLKRSEEARGQQIALGELANPFLREFYIECFGDEMYPEHVGIVYSSIRSRLSLDEQANLMISEANDGLDIEITVKRREQEELQVYRGRISPPTGESQAILLGPYVVDVDIDIPTSSIPVQMGVSGKHLKVVSPTSIACNELIVTGNDMRVSRQPGVSAPGTYLDAGTCRSELHGEVYVYPPAVFEVDWPSGNIFPWSDYYGRGSRGGGGVLTEHQWSVYHRTRKFVTAFRGTPKQTGQLSRSDVKIESNRMVAGIGRAVLERLVHGGIVKKDGHRYILQPDRLHEKTGLTYGDCRSAKVADQFKDWADEIPM